MLDFARFGSMLNLEAFVPFKTGINALENINCISEGKGCEHLAEFIKGEAMSRRPPPPLKTCVYCRAWQAQLL